MAEVLTREIGLETNTAPNGRKLGIVMQPHNPAMFEIKYVDDKVGGGLPTELQGLWTGNRQAQEAITQYLTKFWNTSDEAGPKKKVA